MGRDGWRVRLENGLKLDLNRLARRGFIRPGASTGPIGINWTNSYWGHIGSALIWADMTGHLEGSFRIQFGKMDQRIILLRQPRRFGGGQWYFICPVMNRRASVLWKPPGATRFCSRQAWGRKVAYHSQFESPTDRVWHAKSKINRRLCEAGGFDPDDWDLPPKPKWMRWRTYEHLKERFDRQEDKLDQENPPKEADAEGLKGPAEACFSRRRQRAFGWRRSLQGKSRVRRVDSRCIPAV